MGPEIPFGAVGAEEECNIPSLDSVRPEKIAEAEKKLGEIIRAKRSKEAEGRQ